MTLEEAEAQISRVKARSEAMPGGRFVPKSVREAAAAAREQLGLEGVSTACTAREGVLTSRHCTAKVTSCIVSAVQS